MTSDDAMDVRIGFSVKNYTREVLFRRKVKKLFFQKLRDTHPRFLICYYAYFTLVVYEFLGKLYVAKYEKKLKICFTCKQYWKNLILQKSQKQKHTPPQVFDIF